MVDRDDLEFEAASLCNVFRASFQRRPIESIHDLAPAFVAAWINVAKAARKIHGITK